jgi:hypothetical protein
VEEVPIMTPLKIIRKAVAFLKPLKAILIISRQASLSIMCF